MKLVKTDDAAGQVLCHDITRIIKGVTKDTPFRKGHVVTKEDIPVLKSLGKFNIYVWENDDTMMHENDAAMVLYEICRGDNLTGGEVSEGKIELAAACDGLLTVDRERLDLVNSFGQMMIASRHGNFPVKKGDKVAGTRIIPLVIEKEKMEKVKKMTEGAPIFNVKPFLRKKAGIVTTGREVYEGLIEDTFTDVILEKLSDYDVSLEVHIICSDDKEMIVSAVRNLLDRGCDLIICTGGMSVDPDDLTPYAIKAVTGDDGIYGAPVLPGAMFMIGYCGDENIPVMGLPGCVMYSKRTIFDLVLPRVMAGEIIHKEDIESLGEGGLCLGCSVCTFPNCGFGK
ncbi:MAG: molybdopterin-binding protein [Anaerovoracaceae bacterium]